MTLRFRALCCLLVLLACPTSVVGAVAEDGVAELRDVDLRAEGGVRLDGHWRFAPRMFVAADAADASFPLLREVPHSWGDDVAPAGARSGHGFASYRARLRVPPGADDLALRIVTAGTAHALFVDGVLRASAGRPGASRETSTPAYRPVIVPLPPAADGEYVLTLHVANFHYHKGGLWEPLWIGDRETLQRERQGRVGLAAFLAGGFALIGLYHLFLWVARRSDRSALWFAVLCFAIGVRGLTVDEIWLVDLAPGLPWRALVRVEFVSMLLLLPTIWLFFRALLPEDIPLLPVRVFVTLAGGFTTAVLLLPVDLFSRALGAMQLTILASAVLGGALLLRALRRGRRGSALFGVGVLAIVLTGVHDVVLSIYRSVPGIDFFGERLYLQPFGLLVFVLCQAAMLALRSSWTVVALERATADAAEARDALDAYARQLEQRVAERTAKLEDLNHELERRARVDGLTGIGNRRYFDEQLQAAWADHLRRNAELALILVDVDRFKDFNDAFGHVEGDAALRAVADVLARTAVRPRDVVARYGGEELAVVLPETDARGAAHLAEQMRAAIEALAITHPGSDAGVVTVSAGVAALVPTATHDARALVLLADAALYAAKAAGRNRVATDAGSGEHADPA